ncbi:hypothetical protein K437DRAFT_180260 [Tilletiaria anomala UBC 951]|uniref:Uncharacterized protein n=1 Tax=Tilletiaria anomala (strain ATCC 24038 / CBS 436.72 / UBC 951) TaxID=1037660 RepID=A0A066VI25_TILAU|nr:uncharacterized protein K437DRAFT_180260 [Tilletiaria anomala UBC 951]KDN41166.1 hypothetical protein K437DRAFT_180260 [Tilletiaria anomala UBC 951]
MVRSEAAHDGSDVEVPDVDTMPPLPSQYASAPGSTAMAGASHRHLSTATFASSGSSVSMDYVLSSKIVTPLTPGSAKRVQVANGGKPELVRSFSGNSKGKVRSKRYNSNAATAGSSVGDDDEQGGMTPTSSELAHGGADPFDDEAAVRASMDEPEPRALKNSGPMVVQGSGAASSNPRAATAGFSRSDMGRSGTTTASFGIPIFDGSHYAQGLPLHSFIDPRSGSSAALDANRPSWFDEDGDLVDATEVAAPTVPGGAAPSVSGRAVRARNNSGPHHRPGKDVRQSTASSIGGLSVFDGIPFHLEHGEMPANAAEAVVAARAHQQQRDREQIAHSAARCSLDTDAGDADFAPPPRYAPAAGPASGVLRDEKEQGSGHGIPSADTAFSGITTFEPSTGNATAGTGKSTTSGCSQSSAATAMPRLGTPLKADLEGAPTTTTASVYSMPSAAPTTEESLRTSSTNTSGPSISSSQATHGSSNAVRVNLPPRINEGLDEYSPELPGLQ